MCTCFCIFKVIRPSWIEFEALVEFLDGLGDMNYKVSCLAFVEQKIYIKDLIFSGH